MDSFGEDGGNFGKFLPEHGHWKNLYGSCILLIMLFVVLIGAEVRICASLYAIIYHNMRMICEYVEFELLVNCLFYS